MKKLFYILIILIVADIIGVILLISKPKELKMPNFYDKNINQLIEFADKNNIQYEIKESYDDKIIKDNITWQNISEGKILEKKDKIVVTKSLGKDLISEYKKYNVDESGNVPIMMYHGISNLKNADTAYTGGNVDRDGYNRTVEAFRSDLEFYYNNGYRMIRLEDYVNGDIDVEIGKSPIILTFDDGLENNIRVTGLDEDGNIIIDPNSAVGVLEEFKKKYPEFNVTATFFINGGLFNQKKYNEEILNWLVDNGYDIGNHTYSHIDFTDVGTQKSTEEVGKMYKKLDELIGNKYVNIVALPYGSPYDIEHKNFKYILEGEYDDFEYETISTLRVGWEADYSPFNNDFNKLFLKRIRAYDNNGKEFDIKMNFKTLEKTKYISDGDVGTVVVPNDKKDDINEEYDKKFVYYESKND